jgi:gliding motility-associated-like protein
LVSGTGVFNPAVDAAVVYTYTVTGLAPCGSTSATVTVGITQAPNAGTNGTLTLCANSASQDLFLSLGGTPQVGGVWSPALVSGTGVFNPAVDAAITYTYTVAGTAPCLAGTSTATVTVNPIPNAGTNGSLTICSNAPSQDLFGSLGGTPQFGGVWTPALVSGTGVFNPAVDAAVVYTYTVTGLAPCGSTSATVTVGITQAPNAGTNGTLTLCANSASQDLFLSLGGTPQVGGVWSPALVSGTGVFNPAVDAAITYTYTVSGASSCVPSNSTVNVIIDLTCPITEIIIPDGFSPNGDGINDEFVVRNLSDLYPNYTLMIYNRYGSVLHKGNINTPNWNGKSTETLTIGDGLLPTGVYFFIIDFNDGNRKSLQGRVYLSR